nr:hypothetical protein [Candidatus Enterousia merdequi]
MFLLSQNAFALYTQDIPNACGVIHFQSKIFAHFERNEHTCSSGYFLPANTDGCRPCPEDHICNGGTFKFNKRQSQGIRYKTLTRNSENSCASNISHHLVGIFKPNTINIRFIDNNEVLTTTTCTYDGAIKIPDITPNKKGYQFTGWKIKNK